MATPLRDTPQPARNASDAIVLAALDMRGTITGEHHAGLKVPHHRAG
jgi:hypothetical protein